MSDYRDGTGDRARDGHKLGGPRRTRSEDPLAELARLIDEDPFADFDRSRQAHVAHGSSSHPAAGPRQEPEWTIDTSLPRYEPPAESGKPDPAQHASPEPRDMPDEEAEAEDPAGQTAGGEGGADPAQAERFQQNLAEHFRQIEINAPRAAADDSHAAVPDDHAAGSGGAAEPDPQEAVVSPPARSFDPVSAVAAHLLGDAPQRDDPGAGRTAGAAARHGGAFVVRPPEAREVVRPAPLHREAYPDAAGPEHVADADHYGAPEGAFGHGGHDASHGYSDHGGDQYPPYYDEAPPYEEAPRAYSADDSAYDEDDYIPPEELAAMERRPRRGLMVVSSLVALVVLGGAVALGYRGLSGESGGGEPPVIRADSTPTKIVAEVEDPAEREEQGKLVYERIGGTEAQSERQERLVSREEPVFEVAGRDAPAEEVDPAPGIGREAGSEPSDPAARPGEPRRVRTVVVRPDGTIVPPAESTTAEAVADAARGREPEAGQAGAPANGGASEAQEAVALATPGEPDAEPDFVPPSAPQPEPQESEATAQDAADQQDAPVQQAAEPPASQQQTPERRSGQPLQLVPSGGGREAASGGETRTAALPGTSDQEGAATVRQPFPAGSYVVQVASTRSEDEARSTAASIARQHGGLLGDARMGVERADLGDRGIFYRVGAGGMTSQSDAQSLCEQFKATGLDCFVRRN